MDDLDRAIVNELQGGFALCERPYREAAERLGTTEHELMRRLRGMLEEGVLSRFGPMFNAERMGGTVTLCALSVPRRDFARTAKLLEEMPEVAHNYERDHELNMWFVLATETDELLDSAIRHIEAVTGYQVYNFPKQKEFYVGLRFSV